METGNFLEGVPSGTVSMSGTHARTGNYGAQISWTGGALSYYRVRKLNSAGVSIDLNLVNTYVQFHLYVPSGAPNNSGTACILSISNDTNHFNRKVFLFFHSGERLEVYDGVLGNYNITPAGSVPFDTWVKIQVYVGTGNPGPFKVWIDDNLEVDDTGNVHTGNANFVFLGKRTNFTGVSRTIKFDDMVIANAEITEDGGIYPMILDSDGYATVWTIGAGGGSDWQNIDEIPSDGTTTYLTSTQTIGNTSSGALESVSAASIPGLVHAVCPFHTVMRDGGGNGAVKMRLRSSSTNSDASGFSSGGTWVALKRIFLTDPNTGSPWVASDLNNVELAMVEQSGSAKTRWTNAVLTVFATESLVKPFGPEIQVI